MSVYFWSALTDVPPTDADVLPPTPMSTVGPIVKPTRGASRIVMGTSTVTATADELVSVPVPLGLFEMCQ